ncbi:hypothetical protein FF100_23110 [Methylobacterium terricola]|uniref:Uncharacterized protein n=1 Tax=Methylobacterium terricola TaxID=2583531 RepID=A0A5C4LDP6_9HYPH|nr:hypothetical protein [Methylobacterium terricola]TNC10550.1 hypothetical protein FF100_23110 [Methylobacterium terricola]
MTWSRIAAAFNYHGALLDIYVLETSHQDWARVWDLLRAKPERLTFEIDGQAKPPPAEVAEVFNFYPARSVLVSYRLGKQRLNCHFFTEEEIEFDLDPRDVDSLLEADRLVGFLNALGRATMKEVLLTVENSPDEVIARYDPTSDTLEWSVGY